MPGESSRLSDFSRSWSDNRDRMVTNRQQLNVNMVALKVTRSVPRFTITPILYQLGCHDGAL